MNSTAREAEVRAELDPGRQGCRWDFLLKMLTSELGSVIGNGLHTLYFPRSMKRIS